MVKMYKDTIIGKITLVDQAGALSHLLFENDSAEPEIPEGSSALLQEAGRQLDAYFAGKLQQFNLPLAPAGTPFQQKVWQALRLIPYGETSSYGEVARKVGCPGGARAIGMANNRNPIAIIIPCHRVVGVRGDLVGFGGGLPIKVKLLELEGVTL